MPEYTVYYQEKKNPGKPKTETVFAACVSDAWQSAQQIILTELGATTNVVILKTIKN